ncbi:MAG: protoheme IX farnesyltransferase [Bacteroidales bacterium]|nr:protoheme IX farnesyltransferase [Bacteroidales bacterium]MCF8456685.1 protoheme IX farnesyltransferase [Bacteroidales bacterium]
MNEKLKIYLDLGKVRITVAVTLSTLTGYIMWRHTLDWYAVLPVLGVFFLAVASAALNQFQESQFDAIMERTKNRPIPSGKISKNETLFFIIAIGIAGSAMIYFGSNFTALFFGWLTMFWYNAIYTPLKRKTGFAVVIGALIGALPPLIGYTAAGGFYLDIEIIMVAFFFFIWQVPHFILLVLKFGKEYEKAGLASLTSTFNDDQLRRIIFIWVIGTVFSAFLIPAFGIIQNKFLVIFLVGVSLLLVFTSLMLFSKQTQRNIMRSTFMNINIYLLLVMIFLVIESVI